MGDLTDVSDPTSPMAGQRIGDLTDEELKRIKLLGGIPEKQALLMAQLKQADALRDDPAPQGRTGPGKYGMYVAPHPLEVLAHVAKQYAGMRESDRIDRQAQSNIGTQEQGRSTYMDALLRQQKMLELLRMRQAGMTPPGSEDPGG